MSEELRVLFLGDIVGQSGFRALFSGLSKLKKTYSPDYLIVNGENVAEGFGINREAVNTLFSLGFDVITTGNHVWQKDDIIPILDAEERLLRPINYPPGNPGHGFCVAENKGSKLAVINAQGRTRMWNLDCPFRKTKEVLKQINQETKVVIVDFHAEASEEKEAFAFYLDGKVSAVLGTHTHIQTADERILPGGTAYITDVGMTGPQQSVIGFEPEISVRRMITQLPLKNEVSHNAALIQGVLLEIDRGSGKTKNIQRIFEYSIV